MIMSRIDRRRGSTARAVLTGLLVLVSAACGTEPQSGATRIPPERVPFDLLAPAEVSEPASAMAADGEAVALYFVEGGHLEPVFRQLDEDPTPVEVLKALGQGPTPDETERGLTSAAPSSATILGTTVSRGIATVDLAASQGDVRSDQQALAVAQIVFTLTARPGIGRVAFTVGGNLVDVPVGSGALTDDAVAREDYTELAPPRS